MEPRSFNVPRYLSVLPLFNDLSPAELSQVAAGCQLRRLARGDMVFHVGDACHEFHVVVTGQVKLFVLSPDGHEKVVELIGPGHSFGEAIMFSGIPYILSAQALAETLQLTVGKAAVIDAIKHDHRFALRMLASMSRKLHRLIQDVEAYALHSGLQRVVGYLLREQPVNGDDPEAAHTVTLPVGKAVIASRLSLTPEYFSRVLHDLEARGLIEIDRREIRILSTKRLAEFGMHGCSLPPSFAAVEPRSFVM